VPEVQVVAGLAPVKLAGNALAATASPVSWVEAFGFEIVRVNVEVEPAAVEIEVGENAAEMVGGLAAVTVSVLVVAVLPVAEFEAETAPVVYA